MKRSNPPVALLLSFTRSPPVRIRALNAVFAFEVLIVLHVGFPAKLEVSAVAADLDGRVREIEERDRRRLGALERAFC